MRLVKRAEWGARSPRSIRTISTIRGVGIHWEGPRMGTFPHSLCDDKVRAIQNFHMDTRKWSDIAYSHLVCPHGYIYEGRKWGVRTAANGTDTGNNYYHAICYLGGEGDPFTDEAKAALKEYVERHQGIYGDEVRPHSWFKATACPGDDIRDWLKAGMPVETAPRRPCDEQVFREGSRGECVEEIQSLLSNQGYPLAEDGDFGERTLGAVMAFQQDRGLMVDGVVGPNTWRSLKSSEVEPAPTPAPDPEPVKGAVVTAETEVDQILAYLLARHWGHTFLPASKLDGAYANVTAIGKNANEHVKHGKQGIAITGASRWETALKVFELLSSPPS